MNFFFVSEGDCQPEKPLRSRLALFLEKKLVPQPLSLELGNLTQRATLAVNPSASTEEIEAVLESGQPVFAAPVLVRSCVFCALPRKHSADFLQEDCFMLLNIPCQFFFEKVAEKVGSDWPHTVECGTSGGAECSCGHSREASRHSEARTKSPRAAPVVCGHGDHD